MLSPLHHGASLNQALQPSVISQTIISFLLFKSFERIQLHFSNSILFFLLTFSLQINLPYRIKTKERSSKQIKRGASTQKDKQTRKLTLGLASNVKTVIHLQQRPVCLKIACVHKKASCFLRVAYYNI